jgi:hypothetical protein
VKEMAMADTVNGPPARAACLTEASALPDRLGNHPLADLGQANFVVIF